MQPDINTAVVLVFPDGDWMYGAGTLTGDGWKARRECFTNECNEVRWRGGSQFPISAFPARVLGGAS